MSARYVRRRRRHDQAMRDLRAVGGQALRSAGRTLDKGAAGFGRWVSTDHSGVGKALMNLPPSLGFKDSLLHVGVILVAGLLTILGKVIIVLFTIFVWIPFLFWLVFGSW
jgi:hypothetical protein